MKKKSICCKAPFEWTNREKGKLQSNVPFLVCSKCKKGGGKTYWDIDDNKLSELEIKEDTTQ